MRRRAGSGSVSRTPRGWRVQVVVDGRRVSLGVHPTEAEARAIAAASVTDLAEGEHRDGVRLADWATIVLDRRTTQGLRGVERERSRWAHHVASDELAALPVRSIVRADVQAWLDRLIVRRAAGVRRGPRTIARQTASNALTLLRAVLEDACAHGVAQTNAAAGVALPRARGRTRETWTYLTLAEQTKLLEATPTFARPLVRFAIFSGLRQGEQWALELADVHVDHATPHVMIRFGSPGEPTKSGHIRRVDLLPEAVRAVREQLELLANVRRLECGRAAKKGSAPRDMNPRRILFPSRLREHRSIGEPPGWQKWCAAAGLGRPFRWHDLRHTTASSLVAGWWGRAWTLLEVRALLGHSTIAVTERYAHLAGTITETAVRETAAMHMRSTQPPESDEPKTRARSGKKARSHLRDLNSRPTVYETVSLNNGSADVGPTDARACARRAFEAVDAGDPFAGRLLVEAVELLLEELGGDGEECELVELAGDAS